MAEGPHTSQFVKLLDRIRAGDESAKDELVNTSYRRVHALTHFILRGEFPNAGQKDRN
jgi:hypothetical protein